MLDVVLDLKMDLSLTTALPCYRARSRETLNNR